MPPTPTPSWSSRILALGPIMWLFLPVGIVLDLLRKGDER